MSAVDHHRSKTNTKNETESDGIRMPLAHTRGTWQRAERSDCIIRGCAITICYTFHIIHEYDWISLGKECVKLEVNLWNWRNS